MTKLVTARHSRVCWLVTSSNILLRSFKRCAIISVAHLLLWGKFMINKLSKFLIPILILLLIVLYISIVITNNYIADKVEKELKSYQLPTDSVLVESISVTGKLTGSGNGMQYMGAILIASDLSKQEILEYYQNEFEYIEVQEQTSPTLESIRPNSAKFNHFDFDSNHTYYSVIFWGSSSDYVNGFFSDILDFDLRGH